MPKTAWLITGYEGLAWVGQFASTLAALLGFVTLGWVVWHTRQQWGRAGLWAGLLVLNVGFLFVAPAGWWAVGYHALLLGLALSLFIQAWRAAPGWAERLVAGCAMGSFGVGVVYQLLPALYTAGGWPGPAPFALELFNFGEISVGLTPVAFWLAARPTTIARHHYAWALLPAVAFAGAHLANPSLTAILSIWSTGLTLYLPWPFYALSLAAASVVVLHSRQHGWALLLLAAGGYAPQLGTQIAFALLGLWLLTPPAAVPLRENPGPSSVAPLVLYKT